MCGRPRRLNLDRLRLLDAIRPSLDCLRLLNAVGPQLLTIGNRGASGLLPLYARRLDALNLRLLTLDTRRLDALGAQLLTLGSGRAIGYCKALLALHSWRCHLLKLLALEALRLLTLRPGLGLLTLGLRLLAFGSRGLPVLLRSRIGRGRDRQSGDAGGEKYPGHHNYSF
jgi:hypothetical protein